jgi:peptidoglycan/LPS O-acetylase OafA/YrhL
VTSERVASLDLVRGIAAICVAVPHFLIYRGAGGAVLESLSVMAVEVFFVLSGFVLAPQILLVLSMRSPGNLPIFLVRRWMRTVPPYVVALLLVSALAGALGTADFWRYLFYVQNLLRQYNERDYYSIAWSLSVEEWFYLTFPLFMLAASFGRARGTRHHALAAIAFIAVITVLRTRFGDPLDWGASVRRVVIFRVDSIAYGFLLYLALRGRPVGRPMLMIAGLIGSTALMFGLLAVVEQNQAAQIAYPPAAAAFGSFVIVSALAVEAWARHKPAIAAAAGTTSYAVYLYHLLAIYLLARLHWPLWLTLIAFVLVAGLLSALSSYGLEKPILAKRPKYRAGAPAEIALNAVDAAP